MKFKTGELVHITDGAHKGSYAEVQRYDGGFCVVKPENETYEVFCHECQLRKFGDEPSLKVVSLAPPVKSRFQHRHRLEIDGLNFDLTHKELRELKTMIGVLCNE